jgi:hypothetical protein
MIFIDVAGKLINRKGISKNKMPIPISIFQNASPFAMDKFQLITCFQTTKNILPMIFKNKDNFDKCTILWDFTWCKKQAQTLE